MWIAMDKWWNGNRLILFDMRVQLEVRLWPQCPPQGSKSIGNRTRCLRCPEGFGCDVTHKGCGQLFSRPSQNIFPVGAFMLSVGPTLSRVQWVWIWNMIVCWTVNLSWSLTVYRRIFTMCIWVRGQAFIMSIPLFCRTCINQVNILLHC